MKDSFFGGRRGGEEHAVSSDKPGQTQGVPLRSKKQFMAEEGESAVQAAKEVRSLKEADTSSYEAMAPPSMQNEIKRVGQTTFYLMDGVWVDARYREGLKILRVKFGSEGYFQICEREPKLKKLLSVGQSVLLVWKGRAIEVGPEGKERLSTQELREFLN